MYDVHTRNEAEALLRRTIALIEKDGWCQKVFALPTGERCLVCALEHAKDNFYIDKEAVIWTTRKALKDVIKEEHLSIWNDEDGRTKEEVLYALRSAAASLA